ncbi:prepilin peptidase [Burkholderia glumae]|uniref:Prepilin leader peptidase/N-methyltransferase n=2 Tax=Burkholderia glumae TaxID=337 RepID=A0AAQ0BRV0_BURGL|nr:A24 family peptidase [Burkholderia glumae]ACR27675.1 Type IV pilus prepilin peptidase PilD [Burkholderia glumae BGR1]AJY65082.1 type IV leader peptidase family protein [Burkholderia glumae LMG 2196 = ATCC 33617]MCM2481344.1 A24 family peptidase [Burkholderia glumae]MCM2508516.1 A24 family peptidase [Burkholderia glumae]MCM2536984.1 A24 family peptidase [Burkholderia glumae]
MISPLALSDPSLAFAALPPAVRYVFAAAIGLVVGSFLNVVGHRLPVMMQRAWQAELAEATGGDPPPDDGLPARYDLSVPRSACPHCGHVLRAWENVPVLSYLALRGRCSRCRAPIGIRYPLVELVSGALAVASLAVFGPVPAALAAFGLCAMLVAMSLIDIKTGYLPDSMTLPLLWAGLVVNLWGSFVDLREAVIGAIAGYLFLWCVFWLFKWLRGIEGIGYGDLKLLAALGAWLGWIALPQILLVAALSGAVVGLAATWRGRMRFEEPLPFGPFLALGGIATLLCGTPFYPAIGG